MSCWEYLSSVGPSLIPEYNSWEYFPPCLQIWEKIDSDQMNGSWNYIALWHQIYLWFSFVFFFPLFANFSCKDPDKKYLRLSGLSGLSFNYSAVPLGGFEDCTVDPSTNGRGCSPGASLTKPGGFCPWAVVCWPLMDLYHSWAKAWNGWHPRGRAEVKT